VGFWSRKSGFESLLRSFIQSLFSQEARGRCSAVSRCAETLQNNQKITTFSDGRQLVTGRRTVRLTNLSTGKSLVLTDAGHLTTDPQQTADTFTGRLVFPLFPGEPLGPGVWLFVGRVVATFVQPGGFFYSNLDITGNRVDLCAALRN
jgi:hypothetical protein